MGRHSIPGAGEPGDAEEPIDYSPDFAAGEDNGFFGSGYYRDDADYGDYGYGAEYGDDAGYGDGEYGADDGYAGSGGYADDIDPGEDYRAGPAGPDDRDAPTTGRHQWRIADHGGQWQGGHRSQDTRRGVSVGVVVALVAVIAVVGAVILWRFFGNSLSHRSATAAGHCANGNLTIAVVADPSIADHLQGFAERFNKFAKPAGDRCVSVQVKPADSDTVIDGFIGEWPAGLGERPALWVPGSSISTARLKVVAGEQTVSDSRSLVTSPVLLAVQPKLKDALQKQDWGSLPRLQSTNDSLAGLNLPGWGSLRLALPIGGNGDATFLAAEAVDKAAAPAGEPVTEGVSALRTLLGGQPKLPDNSLVEAMNALVAPGDPAGAPVHAVVTTEQQLFSRAQSLTDAGDTVAGWLPPGPVALADYPAALLSGSWLSQDQMGAASEFARFAHKPDQLAELAKAGFRAEDVASPKSNVTAFEPLSQPLSVGDDELRATLAGVLGTSSIGSTVTVMLDRSMTVIEGNESRFGNVVAALSGRIQQLSTSSAVGLWTFDATEGRSVVSTGALGDQVDGEQRSAVLTDTLDTLRSESGGAVSFTTLRMVYADAQANYRSGQSNSVLVITAGPHTDRSLDGPGLQDFIKQNVDEQRPVAVNVIDFGSDSDRTTWEAVAKLSGGSYQNIAHSNSPELSSALAALLG